MSKQSIKIVVLQRGWVVVGEYVARGPNHMGVTRPYVIRRWGTNKGLGQLAQHGPRSSTKLDPALPMQWHLYAEVAVMDVNNDVWAPIIERHAQQIAEVA